MGGKKNMRKLDSYLELGVIGMARGGQLSWFNGHFGAALLAGYYMNREHQLPDHVKDGIERTCERYRHEHAEWFAPLEQEEANPMLLEHVIDGLRKNTEKLSTSGHGLALGVLALKALRDCPSLITPTVVNGLVNMLERTTEDEPNRYWDIDNYFTTLVDDTANIPEYRHTLDMITQSFKELHTIVPNRTIDGKMYFFSGELEHGITHAQALIELERFGHNELVLAGMKNQRLQMYLNQQRPDFMLENEVKKPAFTSIFAPEYWEKTFADPHALKFPYAVLDLLKRLPTSEQPEAKYNTCKLLTIMK